MTTSTLPARSLPHMPMPSAPERCVDPQDPTTKASVNLQQMAKERNAQTVGAGAAIGAAVGMIMGLGMQNIALWIALGTAVGTAIGVNWITVKKQPAAIRA